MNWTQQSGTHEIRSTDGQYLIRPIGRDYMLFVLTQSGPMSYWRSRKTIAACKRQAETR